MTFIIVDFTCRTKRNKKCTYRSRTSIGDRCVDIAPINWCDAWWYGMKPVFWPPFICMWRIKFGFSIGVFGGDVESSFFKLKFSGVASSGAESTSKSDSGELARPFWFGELDIGMLNDAFFKRGLLGDDSEPVSWSVSVDIRWRFVPAIEIQTKIDIYNCWVKKKKIMHSWTWAWNRFSFEDKKIWIYRDIWLYILW